MGALFGAGKEADIVVPEPAIGSGRDETQAYGQPRSYQAAEEDKPGARGGRQLNSESGPSSVVMANAGSGTILVSTLAKTGIKVKNPA
ncbi:hypothetical protein PCANC_22379 [Puccinia coronata f. sp. avenae]|uniref:Uncharacterized protein n=1 Tax=Puccinia coronata f. sp. avenae TaxID=200324 RepID=A0A2N5TT43_9BASI|nr:hypothetical protein PCANC_22379 [Puccinia coronata f. sp. avenae]